MDQDSLSEAHAEIETMSEQIGMMNQEMLALEARTRALEAALVAVQRVIPRPEDFPSVEACSVIQAQGRDRSAYIHATLRAALTEPTPPKEEQG